MVLEDLEVLSPRLVVIILLGISVFHFTIIKKALERKNKSIHAVLSPSQGQRKKTERLEL